MQKTICDICGIRIKDRIDDPEPYWNVKVDIERYGAEDDELLTTDGCSIDVCEKCYQNLRGWTKGTGEQLEKCRKRTEKVAALVKTLILLDLMTLVREPQE